MRGEKRKAGFFLIPPEGAHRKCHYNFDFGYIDTSLQKFLYPDFPKQL